MNRHCRLILIIVLTAVPVAAQRVERESSDPNQIIHLRTALNHLTVIELREPVLQVATGSQSFKVEWRENKVFVQPTEAEASTNLFIWTASQRLNYELEPAGEVSTMDFAVDQVLTVAPRPGSTTPAPQPSSPDDILLTGKPVRLQSAKPSHKSVEITIRDLYEGDGRVLVRYSVCNRGDHEYNLATPEVYVLNAVHYPQSLYPLVGWQLSDQEATRLKAKRQDIVPVLEGHVQKQRLEPGQESVGIVAISVPSSSGPTILRFQFPSDQRQQVTALLVH